ncbi:protein split ends isoform X2 [Parasteatoda tepidariorum]|uniref:protein split ends isoform X2 n=1 Tax=Parasteatoda tepidariorum TaxID=114398 RepID=UPI001C71D4E5|nr:dentin sialophosphoprotein isoform X2 [Parasteatoda tepidariorum]
MSRRNRPVTKDMYWFAHGGSESMMNKNVVEEENESNSLDRKGYEDQKLSSKDISLTDGSNSSGPPSLERDDRLLQHTTDKRMAVEERRKLLFEAEQERNDAVMRKHMEREAALEARRNASRSTISFAFGSSIPRNIDSLQPVTHNVETDCMSRSFTASSSHRVEDVMSRSMTASISAPRGRRKNDLMPTVPYDRAAAPRVATSSSSRRRSVSMTRLDQLAQPRKHYVEATKANSTASSGTSSLLKDVCSPNRPLSSASEHSGGRVTSNVTRRVRSSPRKPRPVSIAGTIPDQKHTTALKMHELKGSAIKKTPAKKTEAVDLKKTPSTFKSSTPKSADKPKPAPRPTTAPVKTIAPKPAAPKPTPPKTVPAKPKTPLNKEKLNSSANSTKPLHNKTPSGSKKKSEAQVSTTKSDDVKMDRNEKSGSPLPDSDSGVESDKNNKRIISEEEAKAALAEKRRLAREQAEREAELERQRQEELRRQEEERLRKEEEEQRKMEEESMRLLEEHRRQEEEKLRKAIEDQEQKKEEERARQEEELRLKAEQDRKAKEESEKLRLEMEEKLRREEEERAERKKRLEKIMSRTRGKSSGTSPSGSVSGSDHMDSVENQQEGFSSGANSLESNEGANSPSEPVSSDDAMAKMEVSSSGGNSLEANLTYEFSSNDVSLNSNDLMLPASEAASRENSMVIVSNKETSHHESAENEESSSAITPVNISGEAESNSDQLTSETKDKVDSSAFEEEKLGSQIDSMVSQQSEEAEISATKEILTEDIKFEQKSSEFEENKQPFDDEFVKEQFVTSDFVKNENIMLDTEALEQKDEINLLTGHDDLVTIPQSHGYSADITAEIEESNFNHAYGNVPEITSPAEVQVIPSDHQIEVNSKDQDDFVSPATFESNLNQSFEANQNPFFDPSVQGQILDSDDKRENQDFVEQPREIGENLIISSQTSVFSEEKEMAGHGHEILSGDELSTAMEHAQENVFSTSSGNQDSTFDDGEAAHSENLHSTFSQSFVGVEDASEAFKTAAGMNGSVDNPFDNDFGGAGDANKAFETAAGMNGSVDNPFGGAGDASKAFEQTAADVNVSVDNPFVNNFGGAGDATEAFKFEETAADVTVSVDNPFVSNYIPNETEQNIFSSQLGEIDSKASPLLDGFEDQNVDKSSKLHLQDELENVTLIKQEGSEKYVGIISSIDNDHFSNNFSKLNEHLTNNLECASTTDSEDSSLDSNLSQVVAPEDSEKDTDINNHTNSDHLTSSNNTDNPFMTQNHQSSIPQSGVGHYSEFEVYSNGHSTESSKLVADYGNSILSVENNIFENVGAIDKISSDPFLGKGSSNQISGNPFLMQEEQKPKVLMTSDFLN